MRTKLTILLLAAMIGSTYAQSTYVDPEGTWRYSGSNMEVCVFGINYAPMFAHSYRRIGQMGIDHKEAIRQDAYHFARLGLDVFRIHMWDTEITDHDGNLINNAHLDLFDFTVAELRKRKIKIFLTPLGLLQNGYPEKPTETPGFHNIYDKQTCSYNPDAIKVQANYLRQLMAHVNPYTGLAYKNDPALIGIELNNEPFHKGTREQTRNYIETLSDALRTAGFKNPLFYNMSQNPYLRDVYYKTDLNGFTFQWYPTGLGRSNSFVPNLLPYVNEYPLYTPRFNFGEEPQFKRRARVIYEFGLSNTSCSYAFAAMAEALRNAGFQLAAYFNYDPMAIGAWNTEYPKHFMNLAYTPRSAIGLMIAAETFRGAKDISLDPLNDQALLNDGVRYIYSNGAVTLPKQPERLNLLAGTGSSPLVRYEGTGAYFLDRLDDDAWRLEVMPDAVPLRNPFNYWPEERAVGIEWKPYDMQLLLPSLGSQFKITPISDSHAEPTTAVSGRFPVTPGVYLLGDYPLDKVLTTFFAPAPDKGLPDTPWTEATHQPENVLVDKSNTAQIFFSQGSKSKADIKWGAIPAVTAHANCYGWDPKFVQFGFPVKPPATPYGTLKLTIESLHDHHFPVQVELGMSNGQVFGMLLALKPGRHEYKLELTEWNPVVLARHDANPAFLPALSTYQAPKADFDLQHIESLRFTIGPNLSAEQKKHALGLRVMKAWLE